MKHPLPFSLLGCSFSLLLPAPLLALPISGQASAALSLQSELPWLLPVAPSPFDPGANATASSGGQSIDLGVFLGANRYYAAGITGQGSVTTNLEAGHLWNGHQSLSHVTSFTNSTGTWGGGATAPLFDRHATWVAMLIGGRPPAGSPVPSQTGLAPATDLRSAAIASAWNGSAYALGFGITVGGFGTAMAASFGSSDVINSSFGYSDVGGVNPLTIWSDAFAFLNPQTLYVTSAGNGGPAAGSVSAPGSGYNTLTVGALAANGGFTNLASFSSRSPQDFAYYNDSNQLVSVAGVRAAVDLVAPGEAIVSAFYGGQSGGNNPSLAGSADLGSDPTAVTTGLNGTSFAAPLVAGAAALVNSAARHLAGLAGTVATATQAVVSKALLLTAADKVAGWTNGLTAVVQGGANILRTTQSLDWGLGAGRLNLDRAFDIQVNGQLDVPGTGAGLAVTVDNLGWDFGSAQLGLSNDYVIGERLADEEITATLSWERVRDYAIAAGSVFVADVAQADLNLQLWHVDDAGLFTDLVAESVSPYNTVEHLSLHLPSAGRYGLRVSYGRNSFDNTSGDVWGSAGLLQSYGLAWSATAAPSVAVPGPLPLGAAAAAQLWARRLRRRLRSQPRCPHR